MYWFEGLSMEFQCASAYTRRLYIKDTNLQVAALPCLDIVRDVLYGIGFFGHSCWKYKFVGFSREISAIDGNGLDPQNLVGVKLFDAQAGLCMRHLEFLQ